MYLFVGLQHHLPGQIPQLHLINAAAPEPLQDACRQHRGDCEGAARALAALAIVLDVQHKAEKHLQQNDVLSGLSTSLCQEPPT